MSGLSWLGTPATWLPALPISFVDHFVVVAEGMWESASSISKVRGKGGKQHYRFPGFP
jgi:hypothetical protein